MAGVNYEGTNLVGAPFKPYVNTQIIRRQELLGSLDKTNEQIVWENANTSWIRLASSINIENSKTVIPSLADTAPSGFGNVGISTTNLSFAPPTNTTNVVEGDEGTRRVKLLELGGDPSQYFGNTLAKYLVLFNGTSYQNTNANLDNNGNVLGGPSPLLKEGIGGGENGIYSNNAYGFMGTEFGFTAMPGLLDATITSRNMGSLREATINIRANSEEQFKLIDNLYCRIGYSMFLEWGNSVYFNNKGEYTRMGSDDGVVTLIYEFLEPNLTGIDRCPTQFIEKIEKKREISNGNYDAIFARVANFSWEFTQEGYYLVTLKLISWGDIIESLGVDASYGDVDFDPTSEGTFIQPNNSSALNTFISIAAEPDTEESSTLVVSLKDGVSDRYETTKTTQITKRKLQAGLQDSGLKVTAGFYTSTPVDPNLQISSDYNVDLNYNRSLTNSFNKIISANAVFNENTYFYIRFGDILDFIKERLLIYESVCGKPIVDINTDPNKNYCYYTGVNMSADPSKVMVGIDLPFDLGTLTGLKNSVIDESGQPAWPGEINQETVFLNPQEVRIEPFSTVVENTDIIAGNIMNIYFEASFLQKVLEERRNKRTKKVSLFSFLNVLIEEANSCLGGVNKLALRIKDDQVLEIYDQVPIYGTQDNEDPTAVINLYGVQLNNGSFVKQFSLKTELTNEFATVVSIGAQSNGNVVGEDATMLSKWNFGLVDRFYPGKVDSQRKPDKNKKEVTPEEAIQKLVQKLKFLWLGYADGKITSLTRTKFLIGLSEQEVSTNTYYFKNFDTKRFSEFVKAQQDWLQELIKLKSEEQQVLSNQIGMLPINISTTMQGLSGIRIYDQYPVDVRFIPNYYPQYLKFIIKGVNHSIRDNIWETNIETIAVPKLVKTLNLRGTPITFTSEEALGGEIEQVTPEGNTGAASYTNSPLARRLRELGRTNGNLQFKDVARVGRANERVDSPRQGLGSTVNLGDVYNIKLASSSNLSLNNWSGGGAVGLNFAQLYWLARPAQEALQKLAKQATDEGIVFTINSTYRSYAYQENTKRQYPKTAAGPGSSPHGWGGAIDILELNRAVGGSPSADVNKVQRQTNDLYRWLALNAPKYGWVNPKRLADGINQEEIWHWEWWGTQGLDKLTR
jgi:hypothetical protein